MDRRHLPLTALRSFEAAGRHLSFTRAAAALGVTHGAVSRQVSGLEEILGVRLFERGARLALTREGEQLYERVRAAFGSLSEALADLRRPDDRAVLRVNAPPTFTMRWLIPRLSTFQRRNPDVEVRLSTGIEQPRDDDAHPQDVVIRRLEPETPFPRARAFLSSSLLAVGDPELAAQCPPATAADLARFQLLEAATSHVTWKDWFSLLPAAMPQEAKIVRFEQMFFATQAALDGYGIALLPSALVLDDLAAGRLVVVWPLTGVHERDYCFSARPRALASDASARFTAWLAKEGEDANVKVGAG